MALAVATVVCARLGWGQTPSAGKPVASPVRSAAVDFEKLKAQAEAARYTDQSREAITLYKRLVGIRPDWAEGWWFLGALQYDLDEYPAAATAFARYTQLAGTNGQGWGMRGLCEYRVAQYAKALQHLAKARELGLGGNQELARVVRYHVGCLLILGGRFEAALDVLKELAAEGRELPAVLESMGMAVLRMESLPDTLRPEQREMAGEFGRAAWLAARQNSEESFRVYEQLEAKHRGKPNVAYAFGAALVAEKERERAISFFNQELDRDPRHVAAMLQIAFEELAAGNFEEALASGRRALAVSPNNSAACYVTGRAFLYLDNPRQAVLMLEKAGKLAPDSARIFYTLWQAYQRAGRSVEAARARAEFDRLARLELQKKGELVSADSQYGEPRPEK